MMTIGSLCSGIGGLELGLERAGLGPVVWQVEVDPYCRAVLAKHWPQVTRFDDVKEVRGLPHVEIVCAGFPCQPVSVAGKRKAQADERWLWPHVARVVEEVRPSAVIIENVLGLRTAGLRDVLRDLAALGFDAEWAVASAFEVGAPHIRKRLFVVATHPGRVVVRHQPGWLGRAIESARAAIPQDFAPLGDDSDANSVRRLESSRRLATQRGWPQRIGWSLDPLATLDDGVSARMVGKGRRALGNAVVVPVAEAVGRGVMGSISAVSETETRGK